MEYPTYIPLKAMIQENCIYIWWMLKWRPVAYYMRKGVVPSVKKQKEVIRKVALNTGLGPNQKYKIVAWEELNDKN
jgi:hypothetical protein